MNSFADAVWNCKSVSEALKKFCTSPNDVSGIITLYNYKPKLVEQPIWEPSKWQQELINLLNHQKEEIFWITNENLKELTEMARVLSYNQSFKYYFTSLPEDKYSFLNTLKKAFSVKWKGDTLFVLDSESVYDFATYYKSGMFPETGKEKAYSLKGKKKLCVLSDKLPKVNKVGSLAITRFKVSENSLERI